MSLSPEDGVEVVAEQVAAEADDLEGVLHAVEEPLRQPPDLKAGAQFKRHCWDVPEPVPNHVWS